MATNQPSDTVIAVQVRKVDPPQFVADDMTDLLERLDNTDRLDWDGEQCDSCGCWTYVIEHVEGKPLDRITGWQVRCCGNADVAEDTKSMGGDPEQVEAIRTGCGATYMLRYLPEDEVAF